ncbi:MULTISPECIES: hypothetical protein [unclassified Streptomyces]|uniref:hypothetical protein n=1 Tax=unclassified Streptomyces TaxID=2593676 RepID=UPI003829F223
MDERDDEGVAAAEPFPVLRVHNRGPHLLELLLEPYGSDHWLRPGVTFVVYTLGPPSGVPFEVDHEPGRITVYAESLPAYVGDEAGEEIDCGHDRPLPPGPFRPPPP